MKKKPNPLQIALHTIKAANAIYSAGSEVYDLLQYTKDRELANHTYKLCCAGLDKVDAVLNTEIESLTNIGTDSAHEQLIDYALTRLPELHDELSNIAEDLYGLIKS